jgi:hypothetical protein
MVTLYMSRVEQMASHAVFGMRKTVHPYRQPTVSSLRYSSLPAR